jgi:predicted AlkP superfamily phosphohydrolase/phosphomutase/tetratricopeptide (TPR) repeat protein
MSTRLTRRVLLIGWDAADWKIINPLMEAGKMPVLQRLVEYGISGKISTLQPALSPILWNSIATGKRADKHGILGFMEPSPDGKGARPVTSTSRRAKAIWNILSQQGLRSHVVNWFASHPAEPIDGIVFSNRLTEHAIAPDGDLVPLPPTAVHPPELRDVAEDLRMHPREITMQQMALFFERGKPLPEPKDPRVDMLVRTLAQCASVHNAATWLAARNDWDLLAVYNDAIDHTGHTFIEYHQPAMAHVSAEDAAIYGEVVNGMYRLHDMMLGTLLDLAGPESTVILISDHGFYSDHLRPKVLEHFRDPLKKFGPEMNPVSWHRPHGIFVAAGKSIKHDELIHGSSLLDIAPTVLTLLGQPVPDDMDGHALTRILIESVVPARIASYEPPDPQDGVHRDVPMEESDPFAARQALQQLAELGYVELPADGEISALVTQIDRDRKSNLAQVYFAAGRIDDGLKLLRELVAESNHPDQRCHLALKLANLGQFSEAEEVLEPVASDLKSPLRPLALGQVRLAQGRLEEAQALLEPLASAEFQLPYLQIAMGIVYARRGMMTEAEAAFRRAIERDDDNAEAHDHLGTVLRRTGRYEEAVQEHMRSAALQHARPITHVHLGMALARVGELDWSIRAFEVALELAPGLIFPHRVLTHLYRRVKRDDVKARHHFDRVVELRRKLRADALTKATAA